MAVASCTYFLRGLDTLRGKMNVKMRNIMYQSLAKVLMSIISSTCLLNPRVTELIIA